ncbi:hypothetical protein VTN00DRAFT_4324 [Thermoascus crustaceus]|uniref:uncharacterized protein n=1 Tax=Thermoascus crustaceus TaxID=5088 RepID=UPI003743ECD9
MPTMDLENRAVRAGASGDGEQRSNPSPSPGPVPPSPTLTNPDMILPYDDNERESSTPSPPFGLSAGPSNIQQSLLPRNHYFQRSTSGGNNADISAGEIGVAISMPSGTEKKTFPRNTWTYEGHEPGRPLSDIGEEEDSGSPERSRELNQSTYAMSQSNGIAGSYTLHAGSEPRQDDERSSSSASSSTVSAGSDHRQWDKFKRRGSAEGAQQGKNGAGSQGVTQDSGESGRYSGTGYRSGSSMASIEEEDASGDETASVILSSEAERILENAKRRLTLMEGNLTKARSSFRVSPSTSPSPGVGGPPSLGPGGLYKSIARTDRRNSVLKPRQTFNSSQDLGSNWHSRVQSETHLPSSLNSRLPCSEPRQNYRSVSAMGTVSTSGYGAGDRSSQYDSSRSYLTHRASTNSINQTALNSLKEVDNRRSPSRETPSPAQGLGVSATKEVPKITTAEEFNSAYPSEDPPSRAQSQLQVRDLRDQMKGLQIKISTLKVKTQEDNLRRRSLQSLRTPSPFTDAERWYTSAMEYRDGGNNLNSNAGYGWSPKHGQEASQDDECERSDSRNENSSPEKDYEPESSGHADYDDQQSVIESQYEDAEEGDYEDEDEAYEEFPPVPGAAEATRHEDREDAFDYENFFLHSAMGSYSQSETRPRGQSYSSTTSVETTRPIHRSSISRSPAKHARTSSIDSVSTEATFATATEGAGVSDDEGNPEDDIDNILYWDRKLREDLRSQQQRNGYGQNRPSNRYPSNISTSRRPSREDPEDEVETPRATRGRPSLSDNPKKPYTSANRNSQILTPPCSSPREAAGSATPTSAFVSSLVSSVSTTSSPAPGSLNDGSSGLNNDDTRLLEQLFQSLGKVCLELQTITNSPDADPKAARVFRRRLDAARRVLDGQLDT